MEIEKLVKLTEKEILNTRLCDIDFDLKSSSLMRPINDLYYELNQNLVNFIPKIWTSNEWFSPDGQAGFAIPFYLHHPRLIALEKKYTSSAEGSTYSEFMKLLRHETAHALDNAFHLRKLKKRQEIFGLSKTDYPKNYTPNPQDRSFVINLSDHYAQSHPDEDWAESFAVWLNPASNWQVKYSRWKAIEKLNYLDNVFKTLRTKRPKVQTCHNSDCISLDTRTIREYYKDKNKQFKTKRKSFIKTDQKIIAQYIVSNPSKSRKIIDQFSKNRFITNKLINECKQTQQNKNLFNKIDIDEKQISHLTKQYLRSGRYKVIM